MKYPLYIFILFLYSCHVDKDMELSYSFDNEVPPIFIDSNIMEINPDFLEDSNKNVRKFIKNYAVEVKTIANMYNLPYNVFMAQLILDSNAGNSESSRRFHNYFSYTCKKADVYNNCITSYDDKTVYIMFNTPTQCFIYHAMNLTTNKKYKQLILLPTDKYMEWCVGLAKCNYSEPVYGNHLMTIINRFKLKNNEYYNR